MQSGFSDLRRRFVIILLLAALVMAPAGAVSPRRSGLAAETTSSAAGAAIALTRTIVQPRASRTPALAFKMIGQPFAAGEVPGGYILKATLAGQPVRVAACNQGGALLHADGSARWMRLLIDYSGETITPSNTSGATLRLAAVPGVWDDASVTSDADWQALGDTVTMSNVATDIAGVVGTHGSGFDSPPGSWIAAFDAGVVARGGEIITICTSPLGRFVMVRAPFVSAVDGTTHVEARAVMEYWVTQTARGRVGPIYSRGPFIENLYVNKVSGSGITCGSGSVICPSSFQGSFRWRRRGVCPRSYGGANATCDFDNIAVWAATTAVMPRPDGEWDCWYRATACAASGAGSADNTAAWVWEDYAQVRATRTIPPFADGIAAVYNPNLVGSTQPEQTVTTPTATVSGYDARTGLFTLVDPHSLASTSGFGDLPGGKSIEFNTTTGFAGLSPQTVYWACFPGGGNDKLMAIYPSQVEALRCGSPPVMHGASISGTTLTFATILSGGPVAAGQLVLGHNIAAGTTIVSGSGRIWRVSISQSAATGDFVGFTPGAGGQIMARGGATLATDMAASLDVAPESFARIDPGMSEGGSRPDLSWFGEWCVAYLVAPIVPISGSRWDARSARQYCRSFAWGDLAIPTHALNDHTDTIHSLLDASGTPAGGFNLAGGTGLGAAQPSLTWASMHFAASVNGGAGPKGGFGEWTAPGSCYVIYQCGNMDRQHYPGNAEFVVWLLEGDPYLQLDLVMMADKGLADQTVADRWPEGNNPLYGNVLEQACPRCASWEWREIVLGAYAAPEGSAEQTYLRNLVTNNVAIVNNYMGYKPSAYRRLWPLALNDDRFGSSPTVDGSVFADSYQYANYLMTSVLMGAVLDGEFIPGYNQMAADGVRIPLYLAAGGLGPGRCTYWADSWATLFNRNDRGAAPPGAYITNFDQIFISPPGYQETTVGFAAGSALIWPNTAPDPVEAGGIIPQNGDLIKFSNYEGSHGANRLAAPAPFADQTDYVVVNTPPPGDKAHGSFQLSRDRVEPAIVAGDATPAWSGYTQAGVAFTGKIDDGVGGPGALLTMSAPVTIPLGQKLEGAGILGTGSTSAATVVAGEIDGAHYRVCVLSGLSCGPTAQLVGSEAMTTDPMLTVLPSHMSGAIPDPTVKVVTFVGTKGTMILPVTFATQQLSGTSGGSGNYVINHGQNVGSPGAPATMSVDAGWWFSPGPNQTCPATGGSKTSPGQAGFSESYMMYARVAPALAAALQHYDQSLFTRINADLGFPNRPQSATAAAVGFANLSHRLTGGGVPAQCKAAEFCYGDHW